MSYQVLARKWRPRTFDQLVGQEAVVQALVNGLDNDRVHHGFLFTGTRGVGKTTLARILAKCLNCETGVTSRPCGECSACVAIDEGRFQDMLEIDAASRTKVDDTRELLETVQFAPAVGRFKVYIIDEVHMLSRHSFNALLKTLEEPPPHVKFVLATTDPEEIPVTILSRCLRFNLRRLLPEQIASHLQRIVEAEGVAAEAGALQRIARAADGSMRDALSLLDQAIAYGGGQLEDEHTARMMGSVDHSHIVQVVEALAAGDANRLLGIVRELAGQARDLEAVLTELAEVLHRVALVQLAPEYRDPERSDWESVQALAGLLSPEDTQLFYEIALHGRRDMGLAPDSRTGLEMTLLRMLAFRPVPAAGSDAGGTTPSGSAESASRRAPGGVATAQASVEAAADAEGDVDWERLIASLQLKGPVRELARNIRLESRDGGHWRFLIPDEVGHLGSRSLLDQLQAALSSQIGREIRVNVKTVSGTVQTPAAASQQADLRRRSEAELAIEQDPTVQALRDQFGARIIDDTIQPLQ